MNEVDFNFERFTYHFEFDAPTFVDLLHHQPPKSMSPELDPKNSNDAWFME